MPEIEGAGVALNYVERGSGHPLLVVHGMASDARAWDVRLDALARAGARAIAFDRRGYGASGAPEPYVATTVQEQSEDAAALLERLDAAPALLVGEGFGALVALELLVRRPRLATGAVLADPPLFAFAPEANEVLGEQRERLQEALRKGGPPAALRAWVGEAADEARVRTWQRGFFADFAGQASWTPSRRELRALASPVAVVTGATSPAHVVTAADAAATLMPAARRTHDGDVVAAAAALLR